MEKYHLDNDLNLLCVTAQSFPNGIKAAFDVLEKKLPDARGRTFYGISNKNKEGVIIYKAAVLANDEGEAEKYGLETVVIKKGDYAAETINDWPTNMQAIATAFEKLLQHPQLDLNGYCVEWYKTNTEVMCMVRLDTGK